MKEKYFFVIRKLLLVFFLLFLFVDVKSQTNFENWSVLDVAGKVKKNIELKFEYKNKYSHEDSQLRSSHVDFGVSYKINELTIGVFYREIYQIKKESRVSEFRPHLDFSYKFNDNLKLRLRNEYRIKELSDNAFRFRLRSSYSLNIWDNFNPFFQNEIFISKKQLVRDRVSLGINIKINNTPFKIKPSYLLEANRKSSENDVDWSYRNVLLIAFNIRF